MSKLGNKLLALNLIRRMDTNEENKYIFATKGSIYRLKREDERFIVNMKRKETPCELSPIELAKSLCKNMSEVEELTRKADSEDFNYKTTKNYVEYSDLIKHLKKVSFQTPSFFALLAFLLTNLSKKKGKN